MQKRSRFTVGDLKALLKDVPDDTVVLASAFDHSYREVSRREITFGEAGCYKNGEHYSEYYGPEHLSAGEVVIKALLLP